MPDGVCYYHLMMGRATPSGLFGLPLHEWLHRNEGREEEVGLVQFFSAQGSPIFFLHTVSMKCISSIVSAYAGKLC